MFARRIRSNAHTARARSMPAAAAAALLGILLGVPAAAIPGDSDPSFGGFGDGGSLILSGYVEDMALQADEKIVLVMQFGFHVRRLNPNGTFDSTFGGDGKVDLSNPQFTDAVFTGVAIQPDGKIVVVGYTYPSPQDFLIVRLTAGGSLDTSFGGDGIVTIDFDNDYDRACEVAVQPDGMIVVGGYSDIGGDFDFSVARLLPNGSLDTDFAGDGQATVPFGGSDICVDMALQTNGKIVLVGWTGGTIDQDWAIARLNFNGTRDNGWGGDGKVTVGFGDLADYVSAVAIAPNGKIVVTGEGNSNDDGKMAVFTSTGSLDAVFDGDGKIINTDSSCDDVAVQANGRIVTVGWHDATGSDTNFAVHRRHSNAVLDTSFDGDGFTYPNFGGEDRGTRLVIQADGRILAAGITKVNGVFKTALIRFWADGEPDEGGSQAMAVGDAALTSLTNGFTYGLVAQADGGLVVAGTVMNAAQTASDFALTRLLPNGTLDASYGTAGRTTFDLQGMDVARGIALQADGKSVVAGYTGTTDPQFLVTRFGSDGGLDPSFGSGGAAVLDFAGGADFGHAVALAPDGKIVVAGSVYNGSNFVFGVARFNTNGTPDPSFDGDGKVLFSFGLPDLWCNAVLVQPDGKIIAAGQANGDFALVRFLTTGAVDTSWGVTGAGSVITNLGGQDAIRALALDPSGDIFAAGGGRASADFAIVRYTPNGQLSTCGTRDCSGGGWPTGQVSADWGGAETAWAIDVRDGRVVAAGCAGGQLAWAQFSTMSTLNPILTLVDVPGDAECEAGGETFTKGGAGVQFLFSDKVVVAATSNFEGDRNLLVAGFETTAAATSDTGEEDEVDTAISTAARLHPAYPNPLVRQSVLAFDLPRAEAARVRIYDVGGRLVRTLTQGDFAAGRHQATWDARDDRGHAVAAGVYYVRLDAGAARAQRSVVVLR